METPYDAARCARALAAALGSAEAAERLLRDAGSLAVALETSGERLFASYGIDAARADAWEALRWMRGEAAASAVARAESLKTPELLAAAVAPLFEGLRHEAMYVVPVDPKLRPVARPVLVGEGAPDWVPVCTRRIFEVLLREGATGAFLAHNHPSGDPTPSTLDRLFTKKIGSAATPLGIRIYDHLVVAGARAVSIAQGSTIQADEGAGATTEVLTCGSGPRPRVGAGAAWLCGAVALTGVVDRIDGPYVVLEARGARRVVSRGALPASLREGDVVKGGRVDVAATRRRRAKTRALLERLRARAPVQKRRRR